MEAAPPSQSTASPLRATYLRDFASCGAALIAGALLRVWMLTAFFEVSGDSQIYGGIATHLLRYGRYALRDSTIGLVPTLIRLPGYPFFLAACFRLFGIDHYFAASVIQITLELLGCVLLAWCARRIAPQPYKSAATHATLWLAALCPFTAIYAVQPLTESLSLFTMALALWAVVRFQDKPGWPAALAFTLAVTYAALLRPDGALVGVALAPVLLLPLRRIERPGRQRFIRMTLVCLLLAVTPFAAWTLRNARTFHVFQPLAPRYATDPGENTWPGFQRWTKTWCLDFISTFQIYWNIPGDSIDINQLPDRAFDSPAQRAQTADLFAAYDANHDQLTPALDARLNQLAQQRIAAHPLRYYVWLPLGRLADMWLRPRVENLPIDYDWWVYTHHNQETRFSWFYAALNAFYLVLGFVGLWLRPRLWGWMLLYIVLRSALLCTIEAPESRYTLECFPILFVLGGIALARMVAPRRRLTA